MPGSFSKTFRRGGVKATVKSIDRGLKEIQTKIKNLQVDRTYVKAGLTGTKATTRRKQKKGDKSPPPTNVQLGIIHEFGTKNIPARPFIRPPFEKHKAEYLELLTVLVKGSIYSGKMRLERGLGIIGAKMAADQKGYVTEGPQIPPPNQGFPDKGYWLQKLLRGEGWKDRERNNRRKRGLPVFEGPYAPPRTLVDTGLMIASITWGVVQRSSGDAAKEG